MKFAIPATHWVLDQWHSDYLQASGENVTAAGLLIWDSTVLLVKSTKSRNWTFPQGHVRPHEHPAIAARREAGEEVHLRRGDVQEVRALPGGSALSPTGNGGQPQMKHYRFYLFVLRRQPEIILRRREVIEHHWFPVSAAWFFLRLVIQPRAKKDLMIQTLWRASACLKE